MKKLCIFITVIMLSGCSVFGKSGIEIAPYKVIESDGAQKIELRHYDRLVLVSTPMQGQIDERQNRAFGKLFDYISGENKQRSKIEMTAPVFMGSDDEDSRVKIPMTAPVFMGGKGDQSLMSFVLPESFSLENAPIPQDPDVKLHELKNYTVAAITFSGVLKQKNIEKHKAILEAWIEKQGYKKIGSYKAAGYNPPFTLPAFRRNEVLIPVHVK